MAWNQLKTFVLLSSIMGLLVVAGRIFGGNQGAVIALAIALGINFFTYFYSDKIVLSIYNAKPLPVDKYRSIVLTVQELSERAEIPMPKMYIIDSKMPNAFATGRGPGNSSVAVTTGILEILDESEIRAVLAHELSHVINRDILVATIAATIAAAIGMLVDWARWSIFWRSNSENQKGSPAGTILVIIFFPIISLLMQLAISRTREYMADESGARLCGEPLALASALKKISGNPNKMVDPDYSQRACSALFISNPFTASGLFELFSTHPAPAKRIKALENMSSWRDQ